MSLQTINNGTFDNDGSAEKIRLAFGKVKAMFEEIYGNIPFTEADFSGNQGYILTVNATEDAFELVPLSGGGDMLASNNLSELTDKPQARVNLGLGSAAQNASSAFATSTQGAKADSALQSVQAGTGITVNNTDPLNPIITNSETNDNLASISIAPSTGILTFTLVGGGTVTIDLSAYLGLYLSGFEVKKGSGNTDYENIEVGDYCHGWDGDSFVAFKVNALPISTESNRTYVLNAST